MRKFIKSLILALMTAVATVPVGAATETKEVKEMIPQNIIVKQTTHFNDGRTLTVYYKKQGNQCEVYSPCNEKDYNMNDVKGIKSTNFEVVQKTEGKLYRKATMGEVMRFMKEIMDNYR